MSYLQTAVANERIADMRRAADRDRRIRASLSVVHEPVPVRRRRFRRSLQSTTARIFGRWTDPRPASRAARPSRSG